VPGTASSNPPPGGQLAAIEAVGLIHALIGAFIGLGVEETLAFVSHQGFEELAMMFFHLRVEVLEKNSLDCCNRRHWRQAQ